MMWTMSYDVDDVVQCGQLDQVEHRVSVTEREGQMSYDVDSKHHTVPYHWYTVDSKGAEHKSAFGDKIWEWGEEKRRRHMSKLHRAFNVDSTSSSSLFSSLKLLPSSLMCQDRTSSNFCKPSDENYFKRK